jgi:beta-glucanase (GH16 family)
MARSRLWLALAGVVAAVLVLTVVAMAASGGSQPRQSTDAAHSAAATHGSPEKATGPTATAAARATATSAAAQMRSHGGSSPTATLPVPQATATNAPVPPTLTSPPSSGAIFDDEFNGTTLGSQWTSLNRHGDSSNNELECYVPANATVGGGLLTLTDRAQGGCGGDPYTSAMVQTTSFQFTYGTIVFRAKLPSGGGQWPALWLLGANCQATNVTTPDNTGACQWPTPGSNEIDVFEGKDDNTTHGYFDLHTGSSPNNDDHWQNCLAVPLSVDTHTDFHTYALDWRPGSLNWSIDGVTYCTITSYVPTTPMFLIMNVAVGGSFVGNVDPSVMPQTMQIDYVRVLP